MLSRLNIVFEVYEHIHKSQQTHINSKIAKANVKEQPHFKILPLIIIWEYQNASEKNHRMYTPQLH